MPRLSAVGILSLQAGEDVKFFDAVNNCDLPATAAFRFLDSLPI